MSDHLTQAPEAETIAKDLIAECHTDLEAARIIYLFTDQKRTRGRMEIWASTQLVNGLTRYLLYELGDTDANFVIIISAGIWEKLTDKGHKALIDHELSHAIRDGFDNDGDPIWATVGHDLEEFKSVVERHGLWRPSVFDMARAMRQMELPEVDKGTGEVLQHADGDGAQP